MDKSKQQFEYWYFNNHSHEQKYPLHKDEGGEYFYDGARKAWVAWQASRESLDSQIKPHQFSQLVNDTKDAAIKYKDCQCLRDALSRVMRDSLISNGVKIKNE